jgi:two-component system, OmpR family, sensor kinase
MMLTFKHWLAGQTLRGRLIAGLVALLALSCALVGVTVYLALRSFLYEQLTDQLRQANSRYIGCVDHHDGFLDPDEPEGRPRFIGPFPLVNGNPPPVPDCGNQIPGQAAGTFTAVVDSYNVRYANLVPATNCHLTTADRTVLAGLNPKDGPVIRTLDSAHGDYLLSAIKGSGGDVFVTGLPLKPLQTTLREVALTEIAVFGFALLLTGLAGTAWVRLSLRPLSRMTATATEVTKLPLASGQVALPHRVKHADPRTEVGKLGEAFNSMLGHVESALARRHASEARLRSFAADASHELRTPLAAIRGYTELAQRKSDELPPDLRRALERVDAESARMSGLVDDLLLLARLDAGRPLERKPVDLTRLAIDATSDARVAAPSHRWQLDLPSEPVLVPGDEPRLRQVLANLLSNAAKHTSADSTVNVAVAANQVAGSASLSVTDNGPGIPPELRSSLFERFVRGDPSRSRAAGSTGLGLAIVDAVTTAHGGRVDLTSRPGQTRFTVTLPLDSQTPAAWSADGRPRNPLRG